MHYRLLQDSLKNVYVNILIFFCSFSYRCKVIITGLGNIIEIGCSILITKRKYHQCPKTTGTLKATTFRETGNLIPFHVFFILFQFFIIKLPTFLHKGRDFSNFFEVNVWNSSFSIGSSLLVKSVSDLFFTDIYFRKA